MPGDFVEELVFDFLVGKQQLDEIVVNLPRPVLDGGDEQLAIVVDEARIFLEQAGKSGIKRHGHPRSRVRFSPVCGWLSWEGRQCLKKKGAHLLAPRNR